MLIRNIPGFVHIKRMIISRKLPTGISLTRLWQIEKIIFTNIYYFMLEERLLNPNQSGFGPSDSCIN